MEGIHLSDLANLAIGTPEVGAVNFTALHTLLHAFIKHLQIQDVSVQLPGGTRQHSPSGGILVMKENGQVDRMENRILHLEKQLEALNTLPSGLDLIERSKSGQERGCGAVEDMWQILQLKKRLEVNEEGVSKAMTMLQDLMQVVNTLKDSQRGIEDQTQKMTGTAAMNAKTSYSGESTPISDGPRLTTSRTTASLTQGSSQAEDSALLVETPHVAQDGMTPTTLKDTEIEVSGQQPERDLTPADPAAPVPHNTEINPTMTGMDSTAAPGSPGVTSQEYAVLHTRIEALEKGKADRSDLGLLQKNTDDLAWTIPDLQEKLTYLSKEMQDLRWDRDKNAKTSYSVESTPISDGPRLTTSRTTASLTQGSSQAEDSALLVETPHVAQDGMTPTTLKDTEIEVSGQQPERDLTPADPAAPVPHNTEINPTMTGMDSTAAPGSPGVTSQEYAVLHTRIEALEKGKADRSDLGLLQKNTDDLAWTIPDLQEKLTYLSKEMQDLRWDRDKMEQLHRAMDPIVTQQIDQKVEETSQINQQLGNMSTTVLVFEKELKELCDRQEQEKATIEQSVTDKSQQLQDQMEQLHMAMDPIIARHNDQKVKETNQIHQQLGSLSTTILHIEKELKELHDRQEQEKAIMEQSVTDKSLQVQDQLDTLRGVLTIMASSSSTLLAMSIPQKSDSSTKASTVTAETEMAAQGTIHTLPPVTTSPSKEHLTCPACTIDIGNKVSNLVNMYEHLQTLMTDHTSGEVVRKHLQQDRKASDQDTEVIGFIKNTMAKLQEECERLNRTTKSLIHDHEQKQQHINILYQKIGKLENKKADKELIGLEIDVKADKQALESKGSRTHSDASAEHLSRMMQDLLGKVSAQEQDWQRLLEKINVEMQNKLDRIEIEPLKNMLEERWKDLSRLLMERPPQYEADEAAGIRKQLIQRFHCISCDRTVDMMVPGPLALTIPRIPGLPAHYSSRPHTVFQLHRVRQQSNRLQSGIYQARKEASQLEMSINHLRRIHAHMCKEIARVQLHFGHTDKSPNKTITHQLQTHCATLGKFFKQSRSNYNISDHLPQLDSLAYMHSSRSCGGSHTLNFSSKRSTRFPSNSLSSVQKEDPTDVSLKNEVLISSQEGRFYRGRKGNHLPTTKPKDNKRDPSDNLKGKGNLSEYSTTTSSGIPYGKKATTFLHMLSEKLK